MSSDNIKPDRLTIKRGNRNGKKYLYNCLYFKERIGNQKKNRDYPCYKIVDIGQNNEKNPGDHISYSCVRIGVSETSPKE